MVTSSKESDSKLSTYVLTAIVGVVGGLLGTLLALVGKEVGPSLLEALLQNVSRKSLLSLLTVSVLLNPICLAFAYRFYKRLSKEIIMSDFIAVKNRGYYKHKKTEIAYCSSCLVDKKLCPLSIIPSSGKAKLLVCKKCNAHYYE